MRFGSKRMAFGVLALATTAAGCSTEATSTSVATLPPVTTSPATTTTSSPTTTSVAAPTTTSTTLPATTIAPTTTTPPRVAITPYFVGGADGGWLFLGSHDASGWQQSTSAGGAPIAPTIAPGSDVQVSRLDDPALPAVTGDLVESCFDGQVGPELDVTVDAPEPPGYGYSAIALVSDWPLRPRPVVPIDDPIDGYRQAGIGIFEDDPVDATPGRVEQVVLADLDGDGDEEALVIFEFIQPSTIGAPGDLAALFSIDTATGDVIEIESDFVDPAIGPDEFPVIDRFRVLDVVDLDADGAMEVVVHSWYYEGAGVQVFEYTGSAFRGVLTAGCGA